MLNIKPHIRLAERYFRYLATRFPVMCASDEFHFLPRAEAAAEYYSCMDELDSMGLNIIITDLTLYRDEFSRFIARCDNLEDRIDLELLKANASGILIELELKRTWQHNPLLYLKIAFIGLDHALNKPAASSAECMDRILSRLAAIPGLLQQSVDNIRVVPQTYHDAARSMLMDCRRYIDHIGRTWPKNDPKLAGRKLYPYLERAGSALKAVADHLNRISVEPDERFATETLNETLHYHFLNQRNIDEIFDMAADEWKENLACLDDLKSKLEPSTSWQELYHSYLPGEIKNKNTLTLYRAEIDRLRDFFGRRGLRPIDLSSPVEVAETPFYLQSVRGAASFAAAFTDDPHEKSFFYITTRLPGSHTRKTELLLKKRFHREYKMLTAHETIPGHHFLDTIRRRLKNPIRRQIESPLFYEGWASYSETLLVELGYVHRPLDLLVDYKRRLWRSARCQVDVGLATGKISTTDALNLLETCGFSTEEARRQIDRFRLNPGYQLCYSLGSHEFGELKALCGGLMSDSDFHAFLLEGGELPFHLIRERLSYYCANYSAPKDT